MIPIQLGAKPLADFSAPLEMLRDCHRRIEHFLGVLRGAVEKHRGGPLNEAGRADLERALEYFRHGAPRHTADEEESLFPRMRRSGDPAVRAALAELDRLESDHRRAEELHEQVDRLGRRWLAGGRLDAADCAAMKSSLDELTAAYAAHIPLEEEQVFVLASQALREDELRQVGEEMKDRRAARSPS